MKRRIFLLTFLSLLLCFNTAYAEDGQVLISVDFPEPGITSVNGYHHVEMQGLFSVANPGEPVLPVKGINVLIPAGKLISDYEIILGEKITLPTLYNVEVGQKPVPLSYTGPIEVTQLKDEISQSLTAFPQNKAERITTQKMCSYDIAVFTIYPMEYTPKTKELSYYKTITLKINFEPEQKQAAMTTTSIGAYGLTQEPFLRGLPQDKERLLRLISNPKELTTYNKSMEASYQTRNSDLEGGESSELAVNPANSFQYVLITSQELANANVEDPDIPGDVSGAYSFKDLVDSKIAKGISAEIVTTEWIYANYDGTRPDGSQDNATKIRNFIIDAYNNWETEYILLGGDATGNPASIEVIPARGLSDDPWPGSGHLDESIPSDLYYCCLDGTFDSDADGIYGEPSDGVTGQGIDLLAEVYIGRAPVTTATEVSNFVKKTLRYEREDNNFYLNNIYMVGEYLWESRQGPMFADEYMEEIRLGSDAHGYTTIGFASNPDLQLNTLYETTLNYPPGWSKDEIKNIINDNTHIINHLGHSNYRINMKLLLTDADSLTNTDYAFFGYSQGCIAGSFERDCIIEHLVKNPTGAFAYVANSRYGWGDRDSTAGPSQYYNREFWDGVFGENKFNLGKLNQDSKEDNLWCVSYPCHRWCYIELNLFGDPELSLNFDTAAAVAVIDKPTGLLQQGAEYADIEGSVCGEEFLHYYLEYASMENPETWTSITDSGIPVTSGVLGVWDVRELIDGDYILRLRVEFAGGQSFVKTKIVTIDNVVITYPETPDFFTNEGVIEIKGATAGYGFENYVLEIAKKEENPNWSTNGIVLAEGGLAPKSYEVLGTLDLSTLPETSQYLIRLTVNYSGGRTQTQTQMFNIDTTLMDGWPVKIPGVNSGTKAFFNILKTGDGSKKLVASCGKNIFLYNSEGTLEWQQSIPYNPAVGIYNTLHHALTVADLDKDGSDEIITNMYFIKPYIGQFAAFKADGSPLAGWPVTVEIPHIWGFYAFSCSSPVVGDINNDGTVEIVANASVTNLNGIYYQNIYVLRPDGKVMANWPLQVIKENPDPSVNNLVQYNMPVLADLDKDGTLEIILRTVKGICVYKWDGSPYDGWAIPDISLNVWYTPIAAGDIDIDGNIEIIVGATDGKVYAFNSSGSIITGWPVTVDRKTINDIALADIDGDNDLEIIFTATWNLVPGTPMWQILYVYHHDGTPELDGWPQSLSPGTLQVAPIIGDVDGDGDFEIIASKSYNTVAAFQHTGENIWQKKVLPFEYSNGWIESRFALADLDSDSTLELIAYNNKGRCFAWNLPAEAPQERMPWPQWHYDSQFTGCPTSDLTPVKVMIESPVCNFMYNQADVINISGTVTGMVWPIASVSISVDDNDPVAVDLIEGAFSYEISNLPYGIRKIIVTAFDIEGNKGSSGVFVIINRPPTITISSPTDGGRYKFPFSIIGTVTDDYSQIASVLIHFNEGTPKEVEVKEMQGGNIHLYVYSGILPGYIQGLNTITVTAEDALGEQSSASVNIYLDTKLPSLEITSPKNGGTVPLLGFNFTGTAQDESGISEVKVSVYDYGRQVETVTEQLAQYNPDTKEWGFQVLPEHITRGSEARLFVTAWDTLGNRLTRAINVYVQPNSPPVLNPIGNRSGNEAQTFSIRKIIATDPDNDPISIEAGNLPNGARFFRVSPSNIGRVEYKLSWPAKFVRQGAYENITFTARDSSGATDSETITITINDTQNFSPILVPIRNRTGIVGRDFILKGIVALDFDNDPITIEVQNAPPASWVTQTSASNIGKVEYKFVWRARGIRTGTYNVTFIARDPAGGIDSETITITIGAN